jgi:DNA topoisomerase-1
LTRETKEYNLGTSLKSYIDPTAYTKWAKKVKFDITKFYPKTLQKKFSWALSGGKTAEPECITA